MPDAEARIVTLQEHCPVLGSSSRIPCRLNRTWELGDIDGASLTIVNLGSMSYVSVSSPNPTYKDPATITDRHCYIDDADSSKYFFFVIVDDMTLDVYEGNGPCPSEPTGTKTTLYR